MDKKGRCIVDNKFAHMVDIRSCLFHRQKKKKKKKTKKKRKFASCTKKVLASRTKRASKIMWDAGVRTEQKSILKKEKEKAKHVHRDLP